MLLFEVNGADYALECLVHCSFEASGKQCQSKFAVKCVQATRGKSLDHYIGHLEHMYIKNLNKEEVVGGQVQRSLNLFLVGYGKYIHLFLFKISALEKSDDPLALY